jgi:hypothetical protein
MIVSTHRTTCSYHYQEPWKEAIIGETSSVSAAKT